MILYTEHLDCICEAHEALIKLINKSTEQGKNYFNTSVNQRPAQQKTDPGRLRSKPKPQIIATSFMNSNLMVALIAAGCTLVVVAIFTLLFHKKHLKRHGSAVNDSLQEVVRDEKLKSGIILSAIEDGVILLDNERNIQAFNRGAVNITGWPEEEAMKLRCDAVIKLIDAKNTPYTDDAYPFNRVFKENVTIHDERAILVTRSEKQVALSLSVSPLRDEKEQVTGAVAIFRDVSQLRAEEQRRGEFVSTASHEMRTPVAAIEGYLALSLNEKVSTIDTRARGYLEKAHASAQHLGALFQDLLTSTKAEDGRLISHPAIIEMSSYLEQLTQDLRFSAEKKGLFTEFVLGTSNVIDASHGTSVVKPLYFVNADPDRLREVITNLFDNAVKYTAAGKVTIGLTGNNDVVQFYIRDSGQGIPAEDISHLFQKFYRVDNSATRTIGGTGLGLFICRKIVELYNGHIWVESELGKGSAFFVNLPRISATKAEEMQRNEEQGVTDPSTVAPTTPAPTDVIQ
jgi:PAS domain S-box-containing protein